VEINIHRRITIKRYGHEMPVSVLEIGCLVVVRVPIESPTASIGYVDGPPMRITSVGIVKRNQEACVATAAPVLVADNHRIARNRDKRIDLDPECNAEVVRTKIERWFQRELRVRRNGEQRDITALRILCELYRFRSGIHRMQVVPAEISEVAVQRQEDSSI